VPQPKPIDEFLYCSTPEAWIEAAVVQEAVLLVDHGNCEKKAASTAMNLIYRYVDYPDLMMRMSKLAREELRHFEQVLGWIKQRGYAYETLSPARYAGELRKLVRTYEPARLVDLLICGAVVEARSCERFQALAPRLEPELARFYEGLCESEARHYRVYLELAAKVAAPDDNLEQRIDLFLSRDQELIESADEDFRFHSGVPA